MSPVISNFEQHETTIDSLNDNINAKLLVTADGSSNYGEQEQIVSPNKVISPRNNNDWHSPNSPKTLLKSPKEFVKELKKQRQL